MGAWGTDTFENDSAGDWAYALDENGIQHVEAAVASVLAVGSDYLDADVACEGLAACDVLARMRGQWGQRDAYTEEIDAWVKGQSDLPAPELVSRALVAIDRITAESSELAELWEDSDDDQQWRGRVAAVRERLAT